MTDKQKRSLKESLDSTKINDATKNPVESVLALEDIEVTPEKLENNAWQFVNKDDNIMKY